MQFVFEQVRTGGDRNFAYLLGDRDARVAAIVDPSWDPDAVVERARAQGLDVRWIINTHGHHDHTNGNARAIERTGARLVAWKDASTQPAMPVDDGDELEVGALRLRFLHTPGHLDDHIVVWLPTEKVAITGDLLFVGKIGGTPSDDAARSELASLQPLLGDMPDDTTVWPGHDYGCRPATTIALEKATNPFLLAAERGVDDFLALKRDWARFKSEHGLC